MFFSWQTACILQTFSVCGGGRIYFWLIILHAGLIEKGLPLFTRSFDVILHCEAAFHCPGLSHHSSIGLEQLCTLCAVHTLPEHWVPIQIGASLHSPCLFTSSFLLFIYFCSFLCKCWVISQLLNASASFTAVGFIRDKILQSYSFLVFFFFQTFLKQQFYYSKPELLDPNRLNWVRSSQGCWCVSELWL